MLQRSKKETLYAFALYSDEDAITLCPAANTLENLQAEADEGDWAYYQFEPAEWKYEMMGADKEFEAIGNRLQQKAKENYDEDAGNRSFQLKKACVEVLSTLSSRGNQQEEILVAMQEAKPDFAGIHDRVGWSKKN